MNLHGFGEMLPRYENHVTLDPTVKDRWGMPVPRIHCKWSDNELKMLADMADEAANMLEMAGCSDVEKWKKDNPPGLCIHEMGTARMGKDRKPSFLNAYNQSHDVPNLFITDGACMTSSACQNPSLTYMAITARASAWAADQLQKNLI